MSEKEYGTFGPAVDANTFFANPVYYEEGIDKVSSQDNSRYVNELMNRLGYSYEMIKCRQVMWAECDKPQNRRANLAFALVTTGGKGEGTSLFYESDIDQMFIDKHVICADIPHIFINQENITLFQTETQETSPGYTRLKLLRLDVSSCEELTSSLFAAETGFDYLSSQFFTEAFGAPQRENLLRHGLTVEPTHGPSTPASDKYLSYDRVFCFPCFCPDIIERWISRPRSQGWPSPEMVHKISRLDGHVVPVGFKESLNMYREWRICYSLAELYLMRNLNETQLKVYIILKIISKSVLKTICKDMTSYIMKNVLLWMCEIQGLRRFTLDFIMDRLCDCITYLKKCVCKNKLPSYMIPDRNLLAGRLGIEQKQELLSALCNLLKERGRMFLRCEKFRDAMIVMYKTPNMFRVFSEKRDKVESLKLMMWTIKKETFRPGMSLEELNQLVSQNELYCDMNTQIKHLIQFDLQELRHMGKTDEEIYDLLETKLSQLLS